MSSSGGSYRASLVVASSKNALMESLHQPIIEACQTALSVRMAFVIALSGGSLPSFLSSLSLAFEASGVDPRYENWHVLLADERCVPLSDADSNMAALKESFLDNVPIPPSQIYGIDESLLGGGGGGESTAEDVAASYEAKALRAALVHGDGKIDCAVLGFGPDGHTCSLFPGHALLQESRKCVGAISDSPKPPPERITLTFPVLNGMTRSVIFCGAGSSKGPILKELIGEVAVNGGGGSGGGGGGEKRKGGGATAYGVIMADPAPYPCGMVRPTVKDALLSPPLAFVVDEEAAKELHLSESHSLM